MDVPVLQELLSHSGAVTASVLRVAAACALALAVHFILFRIVNRLAVRSELVSDDILIARLRTPLLWLFAMVAIGLVQDDDPIVAWAWQRGARFVVPVLLGWTAFALVRAFTEILDAKAANGADQLAARSRRTRIAILSRTARFVIVALTLALILAAIPGVRNIGVTLIASAGFAGLVLGVAAQPALKSLIAGIQIALTEPIRLGDYIVIDGESGRVEDITLSFVVIRTGDERRFIVPTAKFIDGSFQNWTRMGGGLSGSVVLPIRPGQPLAPIREAYESLLASHPDWDRRSGALQVSEAQVGAIELKLVMSAEGPTELARLRPAMREAMLEWLRVHMPEALSEK